MEKTGLTRAPVYCASVHSGLVRVFCLASYSLYLLFTLPNKLDPVGKLPCALIWLSVMRCADYTPLGYTIRTVTDRRHWTLLFNKCSMEQMPFLRCYCTCPTFLSMADSHWGRLLRAADGRWRSGCLSGAMEMKFLVAGSTSAHTVPVARCWSDWTLDSVERQQSRLRRGCSQRRWGASAFTPSLRIKLGVLRERRQITRRCLQTDPHTDRRNRVRTLSNMPETPRNMRRKSPPNICTWRYE